MLLKQFRKNWYHIRKPRVISENKITLINYRNTLRQARRKVHADAKQYQDLIQDEYLAKHAEEMKQRHFSNQCEFRKKIAQQGFKLLKNIKAWKKEDQKTLDKFNNFLHKEDLKRINRERIKKIMIYQSENYWYTQENVEDRLTDQVIFPEYIASTEYYHKLHTQALAYESYDFDLMHRVRSNEQVIKEKNKLLIPLFNQMKMKIKEYKTNKIKQIAYNHKIALDKIDFLQIPPNQKKKLREQQIAQFNRKVTEYNLQVSDPVLKRTLIKQKLKIFSSLLTIWRQYTNILGMTSGQMLKNIEEASSESAITQRKQHIMNEIKTMKSKTFIDPIQEDTEDVEITLEDYIKKLNSIKIQDESAFDKKQTRQVIELDQLLKESESQLKIEKADLSKPAQPVMNINLGSMMQNLQDMSERTVEVPLSFLNMKETTSSVEIMKQLYGNDEQMVFLLNQIGEVGVSYSKLLSRIWESTYAIV